MVYLRNGIRIEVVPDGGILDIVGSIGGVKTAVLMTLCKSTNGDLCNLLFDSNISSVDVPYKVRQIKSSYLYI